MAGRSGVTWTKKDKRVLERLIRETPDKANEVVRGAAQEITSTILLSYGVSPSEPGEPPGVDTGNLRAGTTWAMGDDPLTAHVMVQAEYGPYLEFGTEKMAARPFIGPVFEEWRTGEFRKFLKDVGVLR